MKPFKLLFILFLTLNLVSCEDNDDDQISPKVTFWSDFQGAPISVTITGGNGSGTITTIGDTAPDCYEDGNFTKELDPGTYTYNATDGNYNWNNRSFTIFNDTSCKKILLTN